MEINIDICVYVPVEDWLLALPTKEDPSPTEIPRKAEPLRGWHNCPETSTATQKFALLPSRALISGVTEIFGTSTRELPDVLLSSKVFES